MDALVCPLCRIALTALDDLSAAVCPRDGRAGVPAPWLPIPPGLSQRFTVIEPFAHGESGSLYLADEPETGRRGLLKILAPASQDQLAERQRLRRELVKQSTLARSHLVVPLASGEADGVSWLFREWLDGVSLEVRLSREGALPQTEALAIAAQVASALDELHRGGLLHRDVKPGHVFLQPSPQGIPRALLLDAGVVAPLLERQPHALLEKAAGRAITDSNGQIIFGSAGYVAPEQLLGKLISFRSDLYSLGCVLYRMLTGRPAFGADTVAATLSAQRYGELPPLPSDLPNGIGALLRSILSKDPQQRPFSAQKLRRTLDPYLPDGALMEKQQDTSTYEAVPRSVTGPGTPSVPQPSGTLRPPAPPPRTSAPPGPSPSVPPRSMPPPPPPAATSTRRDEPTQQIDIGQIEEVRQMQKRIASSVPPPTPPSASVPPQRLSDKTQPLRLEQILQVAGAQKAASVPPARPESARPEPPPQAKVVAQAAASPSPLAATVQGLGSPLGKATMLGMAAPIEAPEPLLHTAPGLGGLPKQPPLFSTLDEPLEEEPEAGMFEAPASRMKATLMGIGNAQTSMDVTLERELARPKQALQTAPVVEQESLRPSGHPPLGDASFGEHDETASMSMASSTLGSRMFERRNAMYAGAALVGVGVLAVLASALFSSDPAPVANHGSEQPAKPVAAAQPAPTVVEPVAPKPTIEPIPVPTVTAQPAPPASEPPVAARVPVSTPHVEQAPAPREESKHHHHRELASAAPTKSKRGEASAPKERSKSAKTAPAEKADDKAAQFAAARDEARNAYASKNYKAAAAAYEKAAKLDPKHPGTFAGLGSARLQLGDNKAALAAYQRAVQLSPETSGFHAALGRAYLANGDRSKAVASYKKAVALDPKNEAAKAALAQLGG